MLKLGVILLIVWAVYVEANHPQQHNAKHAQKNVAHKSAAHVHAAQKPQVHKKAAAHKPAAHKAAVHKTAAHKPAAKSRRSPAKANAAKSKNKKRRQSKSHGKPAAGIKQMGGLKLRVRPRKRADGDAATKKCEDLAINCKDFIQFCTTDGYTAILKKYCNMGCGYCAPVGADCKDKFSSCRQWDNKGFCDASFLTQQSKRSMCAKTCNMCGTASTDATCTVVKNKYTAKCLPTTCAKAEEKKVDQCVKYCADAKNKDRAECKDQTQTPAQCTEDAKKYTAECLPTTCAKAEEKTKPECVKYCGEAANKDKPECKAATECIPEDKKYTESCLPTTCAKPEEKTKDQCVKYCADAKNKDKPECKADTKCDPADKKYTAECLPTTCAKPEEKTKTECVNYCKEVANKDKPECKADTKCDPTDKKYTAECLPTTCAKPEEKTKTECVNYCKETANKDKPECKTAGDACEDASEPTTYYTDACFKTVCAKDNEKTFWGKAGDGEASCKKLCDPTGANKDDPVCKCDAAKESKVSWCPKAAYTGCPGTGPTDPACLKERCKDPGNKMDKNCQTYCAGAGKAEDACKCATPPVATDPNNYNANCAPTTCAAAATAETEKPFGGCYYHCKANSANAECDCSVAANAKTDFCLETKCKDPANKADANCTAWCGKNENKKRKGCV